VIGCVWNGRFLYAATILAIVPVFVLNYSFDKRNNMSVLSSVNHRSFSSLLRGVAGLLSHQENDPEASPLLLLFFKKIVYLCFPSFASREKWGPKMVGVLFQRWGAGCHNMVCLHRGLVERGDKGSYASVRDHLVRRRPQTTCNGTTRFPDPPPVRQVMFLFPRRPEDVNGKTLIRGSPELSPVRSPNFSVSLERLNAIKRRCRQA